MASFKEKVASVAVEQAVKYARKDFKRNAPRILNLVEKFDVKKVNRSTYAGLHKVMDDPNNNWMKFAEDLICNTDEHVLTKLVPPLMNVAINSYTKRMAAIEKYNCNVPWAILMDPTAACNLKCTGCWAAEYGHTSSLSYDDLARIIKEGKELGTYMYLYTGGEPTMRRKDLMRLCRENPDCAFLSFTNGTLIDDSFADEIKEVGNFYPAFSIEGYEEENDFRRGVHLKNVLPQCKGLRIGVFLLVHHFATQARTQMYLHLMSIWIGLLTMVLNSLGSSHICQQATVL